MLIWLQRPEDSQVAGFQTWKNLGRYVTKGEKGIAILAPVAFRRDADTGGNEGDAVKETIAVGFRTVHVFDISQTKGEPLPSLTSQLRCDADELLAGLMSVAAAEGLRLSSVSSVGAAGASPSSDQKRRQLTALLPITFEPAADGLLWRLPPSSTKTTAPSSSPASTVQT